MSKRGSPWMAQLPRYLIVLHDLVMVVVAWLGLHAIRYWINNQTPPFQALGAEMAIVLVSQAMVFQWVGLYKGLWRFASLPDLWNIIKAGIGGVILASVALFAYNRLNGVSRAVLLLYPFVLGALLGTPRLLYRIWKDRLTHMRLQPQATRVLILGAGESGEACARDLLRSGTYHPVGFLDDSPALKNSRLLGFPVLGRFEDAALMAKQTAAELLVIALPNVGAEEMQRVIGICERSGVAFRMLPKLEDVLSGRALPGELKQVDIDDLLGRDPVVPNWKAIREWLVGRCVLVTGAGGSIGSELCRQCARHGATQILLVEIDELSLMRIEAELRRDFPTLAVVSVLGDCGDAAVMRHAFKQCVPDAVFHAAAYKQVPVLETQLREAVRNNALATHVVAEESDRVGVATFILISTDKAVDPVNVLGASKRFAEMICQSKAAESHTHFITVRFGNVLDSAGSVVPLFRDQIRMGGPVTVTDPEVTRYFMTIPEACILILQAAAIGAHDSIYTLDMGEPVSIRTLAEQLIRLAGKQPGKDIAITYTGLRPGEKLHETLFHSEESYKPTSHNKILQAVARELDPALVNAMATSLRTASDAYDLDALNDLLRASVPEFEPGNADGEADNQVIIKFPSRKNRR